MKTTYLIISILSAATTFACAKNQASLPMDKRDILTTSGSDEAAKEWLRSWHKGEVYATSSEYLFEVETEVENTEEAKWLQRWVTSQVSVVDKSSFSGKAIAKTFVYHEFPHLRLTRDYQHVLSEGTWGSRAMPRHELVKNAIGFIAKSDISEQRKIQEAIYKGVSLINPLMGSILSCWGKSGWEVSPNFLRQKIGTFDKEGRINIPKSSIIAEALGLKEHDNIVAMAMAFSEKVNGRQIAVAQDGKYTRRMKEIKSLASVKADANASVDAFETHLEQGTKASDELEALVKRESFFVTKDLFDSEVREPGDVWTIDASFFNSFLHPDLKGAFRGTAVVRYLYDQEDDEGYFSAPGSTTDKIRKYDVRKLEVVPRGKVDGAMVSSDFSYDERPMGGRFWARYDASTSNIIILVDKKSGPVVYGKIRLHADEVGALPSLSLMRGFKAAGNGTLTLTFCGDVFPAEELAGSPAK